MKDIRVAAVSSCSPYGDINYNLDRLASWAQKAGNKGADIICFPEMNITGYGHGEQTCKLAQPIDGTITQNLSDIASSENIVILAGFIEKNKAGAIFASHIVMQPDRKYGVYRKLHIAPPERKVFTKGNSIPVFETNGVKFGIQLCYDAHFPELSTCMAEKGVDIIFFPHASPKKTSQEKLDSWMRHLSARAYDNTIFIVACNQRGNNGCGLNFPGILIILGPDGHLIGKKLSDQDDMIVADLKSEKLVTLRNNRMCFFLPNRRPELY